MHSEDIRSSSVLTILRMITRIASTSLSILAGILLFSVTQQLWGEFIGVSRKYREALRIDEISSMTAHNEGKTPPPTVFSLFVFSST
jgi:hypothetical protein